MKKNSRVALIATTSLALVLSGSLGAQAAPGDWQPGFVNLPAREDGSFIRWDITDESGTMGHVMRFLPDSGYPANEYSGTEMVERTACSGQDFTLNNQFFTANSDYDSITDSNGDVVISGTGYWSLSEQIDSAVTTRIYSEGDLMRTSHLLTNNSANPVTITFKIEHDITDTVAAGTSSSGDNAWTSADRWVSAWDAEANSMVYSIFWGTPDILNTDTISLVDDDTSEPLSTMTVPFTATQTFESFTIAAGAQYQLVLFQSNREYNGTEAGAEAAQAAAVAEFSAANFGLSGRLARGLDTSIPGNWTAGTAAGEELANTGSTMDATPIAFGAFALISAGAGAVFAARRRRTN